MEYYLEKIWTMIHTANAAEAYLDRKTHSRTLSFVDWPPQSPTKGSQHSMSPKKAGELLLKMTRKLV